MTTDSMITPELLDRLLANYSKPDTVTVSALWGFPWDGFCVVLISHNLEHIFRVSDRMHVLRQGETVGVMDRSATTPEEVVQLITGAKRLH